NSIHDNGGLGIDLGNDGVTPNDDRDPDEGANHLQNFPVITSAVTSGSTTVIQGAFNSTPGTLFVLEFFASPIPNPSRYGQRALYLDSRQRLTDDLGNDTFTFVLPAVPVGWVITATATDPNGNTSEFSLAVAVMASGGGGGGSGRGRPGGASR